MAPTRRGPRLEAVAGSRLDPVADARPEAPAARIATGAPAVPAVGATSAAASAPLVESRSVSAGYGDLAVVHALSVEVHAGEVVALLGPNGAGKTTTLLTLAGELAPLAGELYWRGRAVSARRMPLHRRVRDGLGYVPEERAVVAALTTAGNLRLAHVDVSEALGLFSELEPLMRRRASQLSGGEQQMLTLARAGFEARPAPRRRALAGVGAADRRALARCGAHGGGSRRRRAPRGTARAPLRSVSPIVST